MSPRFSIINNLLYFIWYNLIFFSKFTLRSEQSERIIDFFSRSVCLIIFHFLKQQCSKRFDKTSID